MTESVLGVDSTMCGGVHRRCAVKKYRCPDWDAMYTSIWVSDYASTLHYRNELTLAY